VLPISRPPWPPALAILKGTDPINRNVPYDPVAPAVPGAIRATTVFKFKGMESHVVVLTDLDQMETLRDRRKAYVGMSLARYRLILVATPEVLGKLKRAG